MPDDKDVAVNLGANNDEFDKAYDASAKKVSGLAATADTEFKKVSGSADRELGKTVKTTQETGKELSKVALGVAAVGAGVLAAGTSFADDFTTLGREVMKVQRYTGDTAEAASVLRYQAQATGVDVDTLAKSLSVLARNMDKTPDKFTDLGISVRDSAGELRATDEVLLDVADRVAATSNETERLVMVNDLFGKSGQALLPFLSKGRDGLAELSAEAEKYGLVLSQDNLVAVKDSVAAHREFDAAVAGLKVRLGAEFLPVATMATDVMTSLASGAQGAAGQWLVYAGAGAVAVGSMAGTINEAGSLVKSLTQATVAQKAWNAIQGAGLAGSLAAAGALAGLAAAVVAVGVAYKATADASTSKLKPDLEAGKTNMLSESYADLADHVGRVREVADEFGSDWNPIVRSAEGDVRKLEEYGQHHLDLADAVSAAGGVGKDVALDWVRDQAALGHEFSTTKEAVAAYTGVVDTSNMTAEEAAEATKAQQQALKDLNDEVRAGLDPLFAMTRASQGLADAQDKAKQAGTDVFFAQLAYNAAVKEYGENSLPAAQAAKELTDRQNALSEANAAATSSAVDVATAANTLQFAIDNGSVSLDEAKARLENWVYTGLITQEQAASMGAQFDIAAGQADNLNTKDIDVSVNSGAIERAIALTAVLQAQLDRLNTDSAGGGFATRGGDAPTGRRNDSGAPVGSRSLDGTQYVAMDGRWHAVDGSFAGGGDAQPGSLYRVNEYGTEMLTQGDKDYLMMGSRGGRITPAGQFGGGSSTVNTTHGPTIQITAPSTSADAIVRASRRETRKQAIFAGGR